MKSLLITSFVLLLLIIGVALPWVYTFYGELSTNTADWSSFGSYMGGILSPLVAGLALFSLIKTVNQQQDQIDVLHKQSEREDILKAIEKIELDFEKVLTNVPITYLIGSETSTCSGLDMINDITFDSYATALPDGDYLKKALQDNNKLKKTDQNVTLHAALAIAAGHLNQIRLYTEAHNKISSTNAMYKYYQRKYRIPYGRLRELNYIKKEWNENA
ncbi:MAG: hypothetical protein PHE17_09530 [Thiothrix sp.]|uniref:hypothetical protein n=1 Tax=Thiothrix sp. TaxID=1032 RepID=UPI0026326FDF|nr:hypothetical protein [Thiothrix sp.]MDD5393247.1 hypothetical protein [Thiothrix sp.]